MEESRHETVSDIVAEMRQEAFDRSADASCAIECAILRHYSDRIEAAHKREREAGAEAARRRPRYAARSARWLDVKPL